MDTPILNTSSLTTPVYPGASLRVGSTGASVRVIQEYLNVIGTAFPSIPPLSVDGTFGPRTEAAVMAFQRQFSLVPDGIVGPMTWAAIMRQYTIVTSPPIPMKTIVLDPGHGGHDNGIVSGTHIEKNDNLNLALAVSRILRDMGQRVIMTRNTDIFISLNERSAISNENNADLFVSLHRNSSINSAANGVDNFVFTTAPVRSVLYAFNVLDEVISAGVQNNRGVVRANFAVLRNTRAPAMLLEMGFITNTRDNQLFDQNFNAYASAIAQGVMKSLLGPSAPPPSYFFYTATSSDTLWTISQRFGTTMEAITSLNKLTTGFLTTGQVLKIPS